MHGMILKQIQIQQEQFIPRMLAFIDLFAGATGQGCYPFFANGTASFSALLLLMRPLSR